MRSTTSSKSAELKYQNTKSWCLLTYLYILCFVFTLLNVFTLLVLHQTGNYAHQTIKSIILTPDSGLSTPPGNSSTLDCSKKAGSNYDPQRQRGAFTRQYSGEETTSATRSFKLRPGQSIDTNATDGGIGSGSEVPYLSSDGRYQRRNG